MHPLIDSGTLPGNRGHAPADGMGPRRWVRDEVHVSGQRQRGEPRRQAGVAGFWRRALAGLIDAVLVAIVGVAAEAAYLAAQGVPPQRWRIDPSDPAQPIALGAVLLAAVLYDVVLTRRIGGTVGKRALGLRVESREGGTPGTGQLIGRLLARIVSAAPVLLGFFWVMWDRRKQAWHDKLADTVVLRDGAPRPAPVAHDDDDTGDLHFGADLAAAAMLTADEPELTDVSGAWDGFQPADAAGTATGSEPSNAGQTPASSASAQPGAAAQPSVGQPSGGSAGFAASPGSPPTFAPQPGYAAPPQPGYAAPSQPGYGAPAQPGYGAAPPPQPGYGAPAQAGYGAAPSPWPGQQQPAWGSPGLTPPPPSAARNDPNSVAIGRAGLGQDAAAWLQQVADQVDARLDRVSTTWRTSPHAEAARACAFGLLLGHLARLYPHMRPELNATAELHPSFSTLMEGARLATLEQIVAEPGRVAAWLGPLIDVQDPDRLRTLLD